ncbi:MAG: thiamine pyrophosphate-dependent enzyme [Firmicutes bacterium]|nr:thiamine pyrophosphate-dependent enzyme [Bacillota bacterium]
MKHVGLNVASDPFLAAAITGVNGGLIVVVADDPGMWSSQNEQDSRHYARLAKIPVLEPADSQEAKDFVGLGVTLSEAFDTPVLLRTTTRIAHSRSLVHWGDRQIPPEKALERKIEKYVMVPAHARRRHPLVEERLGKLSELANQVILEVPVSRTGGLTTGEKDLAGAIGRRLLGLNRLEWGDLEMGFITSGVTYQHLREVFPTATVLKLGMTYPLPARTLRELAHMVKDLYVVEELDPFLETEIRALGIKVAGGEIWPRVGVGRELTPDLVAASLAAFESSGEMASLPGKGDKNPRKMDSLPTATPVLPPEKPVSSRAAPFKEEAWFSREEASFKEEAPLRPPVLCPGCPHRGDFYNLKRSKSLVSGDIGCYTLGALPPLSAMHFQISMGASLGMAQGLAKAGGGEDGEKVVAVIGDSTFLHSGVTGLMDIVYNQGNVTVLILDNRITAMTGHQHNPGTGRNARGEPAPEVDLVKLVEALGVERVRVVDPYDLEATGQALREAGQEDGPSVIIARRNCVLLDRSSWSPLVVDAEKCTGCRLCLGLGCPALTSSGKKVTIDPGLCTGCTLCQQVCRFDAIGEPGGAR